MRTGSRFDLSKIRNLLPNIDNTLEMDAATIREFRESDRASVIDLWRACALLRTWNDPSLDIDRKLFVDDSMFLIAELNTTVVGTVMAGYDGHRGWINYLAVDPRQQGKSVGRLLMDQAEQHLRERGCPKINLQIRSDNRSAADFYERLGYSTDDVISMGKRLRNDEVTDR